MRDASSGYKTYIHLFIKFCPFFGASGFIIVCLSQPVSGSSSEKIDSSLHRYPYSFKNHSNTLPSHPHRVISSDIFLSDFNIKIFNESFVAFMRPTFTTRIIRVRYIASLCAICGEENDTLTGVFSEYFSLLFSVKFHKFPIYTN
jgi:hypothetical protein